MIEITDNFPHTAPYVGVVPFKGEDVLLSQIFSRGWEFPADMRQGGETYEETAQRILMDQCGTTPLVMGKLAVETLPNEGGEDQYAVYFWAVVDEVSPSQSMEIGAPKLFNCYQLRDVPIVQQKKVLYDEAMNYAKVVAEHLSKLTKE